MKRTDPKLKAAALWGALCFGVLFWASVLALALEMYAILRQAF